MAKLVFENPDKYIHLVAAKSENLDWRELEKNGKVFDMQPDSEKPRC